jgi:hypothetical protein
MHKMSLAAGFAAGYVMGSRAGRQRYEQIAQAARKVRDHPTVQSAAGVAGARATDLANRARGMALNALHLGHDRTGGLNGEAPEATSYATRSAGNGALP